MDKKLKKLLDNISNKRGAFEASLADLAIYAEERCDFPVSATHVDGDGAVICTPINDMWLAMPECLDGKTAKNKLTIEEYREFTI